MTGTSRAHTSPSPANDIPTALVSVVVPAYNASATIENTLASVVAQTYGNLEILVVDDGSQDSTPLLVSRLAERDPRIRLLRQTNAGPAAARNNGVEHATGEFVATIDADDLWHPTKIEKQLGVMQSSGPDVGVVTCWARGIDGSSKILFDLKTFDLRGEVFAPLIFWNFVHSGSLLFRRNLAIEIGGYDPALAVRGCEDFKFNLNMAERCQFDLVPEFLVGYTFRQGSLSTDSDAMYRAHAIVLNEARARHPELPAYLFRWARAHKDREFSRDYLDQGQFLKGLRLTMTAAVKDPLGAFSRHARRTLLGGLLARSGLRNMVRALQPSRASTRYHERTKCSFLVADPTRRYKGSTGLQPKRIYHVSGLRIDKSMLAG